MRRVGLLTYAVLGILGTAIALVALGDDAPRPALAAPAASPTATFSASVIVQTELERLPPGPAGVSVVSVSLPPRTTTEPFHATGPLIIVVQSGRVVVDADAAIVAPANPPASPLHPADPTPASIRGRTVARGEQILLSPGSQAHVRNDGTRSAKLLVITISPMSNE